MKSILLVFLVAQACIFFCCRSKVSDQKKIPDVRSSEFAKPKDSTILRNYHLLKEFAICKCLYASLQTEKIINNDISPSLYANILNYVGIDTLSLLAKKAGLEVQPEKYSDYQNMKAPFFRCHRWVNTPAIDSLIRKYASFTVAEEVWIYDTIKK